MYFKHDDQIWNDFPTLSAGVIVVEGVHPQADFEAVKEGYYQTAKDRLSESDEGEFPEISAWRKAFSDMNLKPTKYRCAAEAILRRLRKDGSFPSFHPLVDLCNSFSAAHATPIAVIDTGHVDGGITVSKSGGSDEHLNFGDEIEAPEMQEVVFLDENGHAHSRRWCFRQSKKSVIRPETQKAIIVIENHHQDGEDNVQQMIHDLMPLLKNHYTVVDGKVLSPDNAQIEF